MMGRGREKPSKIDIDLSLKIDTDDDDDEQIEEAAEDAKVDERVKEDDEEEMAQIPDNKEEVPEATAGEIEDDSSVIEISLQENTKTKEVIIIFSSSLSRSKSITINSSLLNPFYLLWFSSPLWLYLIFSMINIHLYMYKYSWNTLILLIYNL